MELRPKEEANQLKFRVCFLGLKITEKLQGFMGIQNRVRCRKEKYQ